MFQEVEEGQGIEWAGEGRADHGVTMSAMMCTRKTFYARFRTAVCAQLIVVHSAVCREGVVWWRTFIFPASALTLRSSLTDSMKP